MSWPRLSETLPGTRIDACQNCADTENLQRWREHDHHDHPQGIAITLCKTCSAKIIEPHERLYTRMAEFEPCPGNMPVCVHCTYRAKTKCTHPHLRENGGDGLALLMPHPSVAMMDGFRNGKRTGWRQILYHGAVICRQQKIPITTEKAIS